MSQNIPKPSSSSPIALITGASKGIGLGCARALSDHGFRIALHYRSDPELAQSVAETLGFSQTFRYDLTDEGAPAALVEEVSGRMGTVSVLVNNAGYNKDSILVTAQLEDYEHIFATNVRAALLLSKAVSKPMIKQKNGRIINITSIVGHRGHRGQGIYSASKASLTALTQSIAAELGRFGILCNCVAPGYIKTQMSAGMNEAMTRELLKNIHLRRIGEPKEIGSVVAFLAGPGGSYITGTTIHVNGGMYGA